MPAHPQPRVPSAPHGDPDGDSLAALVDSSHRLRRFWPLPPAGGTESAPAPNGFRVPSGAQRLVAAMPEYGP
ncbi:hypothetical protein ACFCX4_04080 [Kitasatospora sp. NPDC056327]|uniref:hypothetical protein n=1 Tax=Kitasatospora sp. NPDC056327 TaxID=3345785 RepID=UPI0035D8957A